MTCHAQLRKRYGMERSARYTSRPTLDARYSDAKATIDAIRLAGIREVVFLLRGVEQPTFRVATQ